MALIEDLIAAAGIADAPVSEIVTGPEWIMVTAPGSGVAASRTQAPTDTGRGETCDLSGSGSTPDPAGEFRNRPLADLLALASSADRFKASLVVAALNAAFSVGQPAAKPRSFAIPRAGGKTVAVIGEFAFIEDLERIADRVITVGEVAPAGPGSDADSGHGSGLDSDKALENADIAIIRGSALVHGTLETWLARTRHCYTVVYGPSTPLSPVLFEYGADQLVGINVGIADAAAGWIREGRDNLLACPGVKPVVIVRNQR